MVIPWISPLRAKAIPLGKFHAAAESRPELFINIRCFIHSISLRRRRGRGSMRYMCEYWLCVWRARWRDCHFRISFARELISYRLDFPRTALEVTFIERPIESSSRLYFMIDIISLSVCFVAGRGGGGDTWHIYYASITRHYWCYYWCHCHYLNALCSLIFRNYISRTFPLWRFNDQFYFLFP